VKKLEESLNQTTTFVDIIKKALEEAERAKASVSSVSEEAAKFISTASTTVTASADASADPLDNLEEDTPETCLRRQFVASLWRVAMMSLLDETDDKGPFPVRHGDLHSQNILVDETGHIIGVLDWDCAGTVPWETFAVPTFEVSGDFVDLGYGPRDERLAVHNAFNAALRDIHEGPTSPSGRTLADLHDSDAGHVASYLGYWMLCMVCDYDYTGRALHDIIGLPDDIELTFKKFANNRHQTDYLP